MLRIKLKFLSTVGHLTKNKSTLGAEMLVAFGQIL